MPSKDDINDYIEENQDDFTNPYNIIKTKGTWKCSCPWGTYRSDEKPCWHVQEIPEVKKEPDLIGGWAEIIEESFKIKREQWEDKHDNTN